MISVKKDNQKIPIKLDSLKCKEKISDALLNPNSHKFDNSYYNSGCIEELTLLYHNKCCFCESDASPSMYWRVEHFRPKGKSPKNSPCGKHNGYYWLGYEWSNLLLICEKCNNKKSSHFPVTDELLRIISPPFDQDSNLISNISSEFYKNERCLLLNPETDNVEDYFIFKPNGDIKGIDEEGRGEISILWYNLRRDPLILARRKICDDFFDDIKDNLVQFINKRISIDSLKVILDSKITKLKKNSKNTKLEFSRLWFFLFVKFEIFAKHYLPNESDFELVMKRYQLILDKPL